MTGTLAVILVLGGLIFFHELGHFSVARALGMGVKTFSLGFGPALLSFRGKKTRYQVAALPLGGFVSLVGENNEADIPEGFTTRDSFSLRPAWQRFLVTAAGPAFNLVLAWFICWGLMYTNGRTSIPPVIGEIVENTAAAESPIQPGDRILTIDGVRVTRWTEISPLVQRAQGGSLVITVLRPDESTLTFSITPTLLKQANSEGETVEAFSLGIRAGVSEHREFGFIESAWEGMREAGNMATSIWRAVGDLATRQVSFDNVGGPILIAQTIYKQANNGLSHVLLIAAFISVNLGVLNLLPIPVLDGGNLLFLLTEMIARRPVPARVQEKAMLVGLFLLISLMVAATFNDVMRFFS